MTDPWDLPDAPAPTNPVGWDRAIGQTPAVATMRSAVTQAPSSRAAVSETTSARTPGRRSTPASWRMRAIAPLARAPKISRIGADSGVAIVTWAPVASALRSASS